MLIIPFVRRCIAGRAARPCLAALQSKLWRSPDESNLRSRSINPCWPTIPLLAAAPATPAPPASAGPPSPAPIRWRRWRCSGQGRSPRTTRKAAQGRPGRIRGSSPPGPAPAPPAPTPPRLRNRRPLCIDPPGSAPPPRSAAPPAHGAATYPRQPPQSFPDRHEGAPAPTPPAAAGSAKPQSPQPPPRSTPNPPKPQPSSQYGFPRPKQWNVGKCGGVLSCDSNDPEQPVRLQSPRGERQGDKDLALPRPAERLQPFARVPSQPLTLQASPSDKRTAPAARRPRPSPPKARPPKTPPAPPKGTRRAAAGRSRRPPFRP